MTKGHGPDPLVMLEASRTREGVTFLLDRAGEVVKPDDTVQLHNGGFGGLRQYRGLKAPLAAAVAKVADDENVLRHIATKDRRVSVRKALSMNPHLPQDVIDIILQDEEDPAHTPKFRSENLPLDQVPQGSSDVFGLARLIDEGSPERFQQWFDDYIVDDTGNRELPRVFSQHLEWRHKVHIVPYLKEPRRQIAALISSCSGARRGEIDWSPEVWEPFKEVLNTDLDDMDVRLVVPFHFRDPTTSDVQAPLEWSLEMIETTTNTTWRRYVAMWAGTAALADQRFADLLTADEYLDIQTRFTGIPGLSVGNKEIGENLARKILDEGDPIVACNSISAFVSGFASVVEPSTVEEIILLALSSSSTNSTGLAEIFRYLVGETGQPSEDFRRKAVDLLEGHDRWSMLYGFSSAVRVIDNSGSSEGGTLAACDPETRKGILDHLPAGANSVSASIASQRLKPVIAAGVLGFEERFGEADRALWETFTDLWGTWEGTLGELFETIEATL